VRNFERGSSAEELRAFVSGEGEDDGTGGWRGRPAFYARHDLLFPGRREGYREVLIQRRGNIPIFYGSGVPEPFSRSGRKPLYWSENPVI
jgi:hypothetical protein